MYVIKSHYLENALNVVHIVPVVRETKRFLSEYFEIKDIGEGSFVLGIEIHQIEVVVCLVSPEGHTLVVSS